MEVLLMFVNKLECCPSKINSVSLLLSFSAGRTVSISPINSVFKRSVFLWESRLIPNELRVMDFVLTSLGITWTGSVSGLSSFSSFDDVWTLDVLDKTGSGSVDGTKREHDSKCARTFAWSLEYFNMISIASVFLIRFRLIKRCSSKGISRILSWLRIAVLDRW